MYLWVNHVSRCLHVTIYLRECVTVWSVYVHIFVHMRICSQVILCFTEYVNLYRNMFLCA